MAREYNYDPKDDAQIKHAARSETPEKPMHVKKGKGLTSSYILRMQRTHGNQFVQRLLTDRQSSEEIKSPAAALGKELRTNNTVQRMFPAEEFNLKTGTTSGDVCEVPTPFGPVPVPYAHMAQGKLPDMVTESFKVATGGIPNTGFSMKGMNTADSIPGTGKVSDQPVKGSLSSQGSLKGSMGSPSTDNMADQSMKGSSTKSNDLYDLISG
jgi:hypothetical protein